MSETIAPPSSPRIRASAVLRAWFGVMTLFAVATTIAFIWWKAIDLYTDPGDHSFRNMIEPMMWRAWIPLAFAGTIAGLWFAFKIGVDTPTARERKMAFALAIFPAFMTIGLVALFLR